MLMIFSGILLLMLPAAIVINMWRMAQDHVAPQLTHNSKPTSSDREKQDDADHYLLRSHCSIRHFTPMRRSERRTARAIIASA